MPDIYSIGFYNLENLFDYRNQEQTKDKDFKKQGALRWNKFKYENKIENLSKVISEIGLGKSKIPAVILGVCEVETRSCLEDLSNSQSLKPFNYESIFEPSSDLRGMNVGFLYQKKYFEPIFHKTYPIEKITDRTRDILLVRGFLLGQPVSVIVNHWPSRTDGIKRTKTKRTEAARLVKDLIDQAYSKDKNTQIIVFGDFNDAPSDYSIRKYLSDRMMNPMVEFQNQKIGSARFKGKWKAFDQIMLNTNLSRARWFKLLSAHVFCKPYLTQKSGRYRGFPKRTFIGHHHVGGYSDHYPVFIYFQG